MDFDPARVLRASKVRAGPLRAQGVPAILLGVAGIIIAAGASRILFAATPMLPEILRETKSLFEATRRDRKPLQP